MWLVVVEDGSTVPLSGNPDERGGAQIERHSPPSFSTRPSHNVENGWYTAGGVNLSTKIIPRACHLRLSTVYPFYIQLGAASKFSEDAPFREHKKFLQRQSRWASDASGTYVCSHGKDSSWVAIVMTMVVPSRAVIEIAFCSPNNPHRQNSSTLQQISIRSLFLSIFHQTLRRWDGVSGLAHSCSQSLWLDEVYISSIQVRSSRKFRSSFLARASRTLVPNVR